MITLREAASGLLSAVESAIQSGDWKVDGSCDPTVEIIRLKNILAKPIKESFNASTNVKEAFNLDRGCWERGCMAYDTRDCDEGVTVYVDAVNISQERVDETAKGEHEPVAWMWTHTKIGKVGVYFENPAQFYDLSKPYDYEWAPLYTSPPASTWVGLTDEEIHEVASKKWWDWEDAFDIEGFSRAIEAKLKERNGG